MTFNNIFWDFDGTLFNSYPVISESFLLLLKKRGFATGSKEEFDGIYDKMRISMKYAINFYKEKFGLGEDFLDELTVFSKERDVIMCKPFPNAGYVLKTVVEAGGANYLYTHRDDSALKLLERHDLLEYFTYCITSLDNFPRKPSPVALETEINKRGIDKKTALMVGDRNIDMKAAKNAGISSCFFNSHDDLSGVEADFITFALDDVLNFALYG